MTGAVLTGVVLGAGSSRRLGRPKQTLPYAGTTLLGWALRQAEASSLDRVVLVVGGGADEVMEGLDRGRAEVVRNDAYGTGCASSLLAGLDAAGDSDAIVMLLGDMPEVTPAVIDAVAGDWRAHRPWGSVTSYRGEPGHPFVFSAAAYPTLRGLHGDKAVWKLVDGRPDGTGPDELRRVPLDVELPADVDTWEDYERAIALLDA